MVLDFELLVLGVLKVNGILVEALEKTGGYRGVNRIQVGDVRQTAGSHLINQVIGGCTTDNKTH